jgi:hypothetical protein
MGFALKSASYIAIGVAGYDVNVVDKPWPNKPCDALFFHRKLSGWNRRHFLSAAILAQAIAGCVLNFCFRPFYFHAHDFILCHFWCDFFEEEILSPDQKQCPTLLVQ